MNLFGKYARTFRHPFIGPTFFPAYQLALKVALALTLVFSVGLAVISAATDDGLRSQVVEILTAFTRRGLLAFAWITLTFAVLDIWQSRLLRHASWDPNQLPPAVRFEDRMSRLDSLFELLLVCAGLVWLLLVPSFPVLTLGGGADVLELTSVWRVVYPFVVALAAGTVVFNTVNFVRPYWTRARSIARIGLHLGALILLVIVLRADTWVAVKPGATLPDGVSLEQIVNGINVGIRIGLIVASIGSLGGIVREILRIRAMRPASRAAQPHQSMDLLARYLQAVRLFLPRREQDTIAAELSASLASQMEELEKEIGRPLTSEERTDVIRRHGHPVLVAGQHRRSERLIGPTLVPVYLSVLAGALVVALVATVLLDSLGLFLTRGLLVFAGTTLVFAATDRWQSQRQASTLASREREEAQAIQRALLPAAMPGFTGCELAVRWQPATAFGGDCYDAIRLSDTTLALSIADVCGKGLPAALVMSSLQASVRAFAQSDSTPHFVASQVNQALCRNADLKRFVTFFYGVYDSSARRLTYSNAGHNPPAVIRADGSVVRLAAGGMVVGVFERAAYEQGEVTLEPGDRVVLFTDGITEAESAEGLEFGDDRLLETAVRYRASNPEGMLRGLFDEVTRFAGRHLRDDATAMAVAIK